MKHLKHASDWLSPVSQVLVVGATYLPVAVLFRPSLREVAAVFMVDILQMILLFMPFEKHIFCLIFPDSKFFFCGSEDNQISKLDQTQRLRLIQSFLKFPKRRATFLYLATQLKNIPLFLIIVFYWHHSISNSIQFLLILALTLITESYLYAANYYELHFFLSDLLETLHLKHDFSEPFSRVDLRHSKRELEIHDLMLLVFIILFVALSQATIVYSRDSESELDLILKLTMISCAGLCLFAHIWYLSRSFFTGALEKLFRQMDVTDYRLALSTLPLHTSPHLAQFEKTFNILIARLKGSEQELASFLFQEAEKSRYRALGEMSALIAHDLSNPLHVAQYCATQLSDHGLMLGSAARTKYYHQLAQNIKKAADLIASLKARLKNTGDTLDHASFLDAHQNVLSMLHTNFSSQGFQILRLVLDPRLEGLTLSVSRVELIQILDNLYRNAIYNLLSNRVPNPLLKISLFSQDKTDAEILIEDNGTGLSKDRFDLLTTFQFVNTEAKKQSTGLGLRLTRRLIEFHGGDLCILPTFSPLGCEILNGTRMLLRLKKSEISSVRREENSLEIR